MWHNPYPGSISLLLNACRDKYKAIVKYSVKQELSLVMDVMEIMLMCWSLLQQSRKFHFIWEGRDFIRCTGWYVWSKKILIRH